MRFCVDGPKPHTLLGVGAKGTKHDPDGRTPKTVRLSPAGVAAVQEVADHYGCSWGEAARRVMQLGTCAAPYRWPPATWPRRAWGSDTRTEKVDGDG